MRGGASWTGKNQWERKMLTYYFRAEPTGSVHDWIWEERGVSSEQLGIGAGMKGRASSSLVRTGVSTINTGGNAQGTPGSESKYSPRIKAGDTSAEEGSNAWGFMKLTSSESGQRSAYLCGLSV